MSQKSLLFIAVMFFVLSSGFLFWKNMAALDPSADQGWWALSFVEPHDPASLSFSVDNRSSSLLFQYEIREGKEILDKGKFETRQGEVKSIPLTLRADPLKRTSVVVESDGKIQEIYR